MSSVVLVLSAGMSISINGSPYYVGPAVWISQDEDDARRERPSDPTATMKP